MKTARKLSRIFPGGIGDKISWRIFPAAAFKSDSYSGANRVDRIIAARSRNLERLLDEAEEHRPALQALGKDFAEQLGGQFILGPPKNLQRIQETATSASKTNDIVRGCILVESPHNIVICRQKIRAWVDSEQSTIIECKDRYSDPLPFRGIFMQVRLPGWGEGELQIHARGYWEATQRMHDNYKTQRSLKSRKHAGTHNLLAKLEWEDGRPYDLPEALSPEEKAVLRAMTREREEHLNQIAHETGVDRLELKNKGYHGDCSYPVRPVIDPQTGEKAYQITNDPGILRWMLKPAYLPKEPEADDLSEPSQDLS